MAKLTRFIGVNVPEDMHEYIVQRAEQRSRETGLNVSISDVVREAMTRLMAEEPLRDEVTA